MPGILEGLNENSEESLINASKLELDFFGGEAAKCLERELTTPNHQTVPLSGSSLKGKDQDYSIDY